MKNFGGIDDRLASFEFAKVLLQSIPYDGTSTWGKGADKGFEAFLTASENMELYDIETDSQVYKQGIHILPEIKACADPGAVFKTVYKTTCDLLRHPKKFLTFFGGEHSISIGVIKAFYEKYPDITILQLDAHADLKPEYMDSPYNHACALHDASMHTNLIQVGIRSMDHSEKQFLNSEKCYFARNIHNRLDWMSQSLEQMTDKVYITIDLDVFDPSIIPSTGTPEPGGMDWYTVTHYVKKVFEQKNVLGFDIVELAPIQGITAPDFLVAKLYYKLLSYKFKSVMPSDTTTKN